MSKRSENRKSEYDIVCRQFLTFQQLEEDIDIINIVGKYKGSKNEIGENTDHLKFDTYKELFDSILREEEYTILLLDDSLITMNYIFDDEGRIQKHNLSFVPSYKNDLMIENDERYVLDSESDEDANISEVDIARRLSSYIRIDYDNVGKQLYYHSTVHMHIGVFDNGLRLPLQHAVYPNEFLFLIFKYIYQIEDGKLGKLENEYSKECLLSELELSKFKISYGNKE